MNPVRSYNTLYVASHAVTIIALIGILISIPSYAYTLGDHQEGVNSATRYTSSPTSLLTQSAILSSPVPMQSGGGLRHPQNGLLPISTDSKCPLQFLLRIMTNSSGRPSPRASRALPTMLRQ